MRKKSFKIVAIVVGLVIGAALSRELVRSEVDRHLVAIERLRYPPPPGASSRDKFSSDYLRWLLQGRPDSAEVEEERYRRMDALAELGYLERRTFRFKSTIPLDMANLKKMDAARNEVVPKKFRDAGLFNAAVTGRTIKVTAQRGELEFWPEVIRKIENTSVTSKNTGANSL